MQIRQKLKLTNSVLFETLFKFLVRLRMTLL